MEPLGTNFGMDRWRRTLLKPPPWFPQHFTQQRVKRFRWGGRRRGWSAGADDEHNSSSGCVESVGIRHPEHLPRSDHALQPHCTGVLFILPVGPMILSLSQSHQIFSHRKCLCVQFKVLNLEFAGRSNNEDRVRFTDVLARFSDFRSRWTTITCCDAIKLCYFVLCTLLRRDGSQIGRNIFVSAGRRLVHHQDQGNGSVAWKSACICCFVLFAKERTILLRTPIFSHHVRMWICNMMVWFWLLETTCPCILNGWMRLRLGIRKRVRGRNGSAQLRVVDGSF